MNIKVEGFRRPFAIGVSLRGDLVCLTETLNKNIYIFFSNSEFISKDIIQMGLSSAKSLAVNEKNEIIILDDISRTLNWFNFQLDLIASCKLPGLRYGAMKFDNNERKLYLSVLDLSMILQISSYGNSINNFFDYSSIDGCDNVDGLAIKNERLLLLDSLKATLFDVSFDKNMLVHSKYLQYGRDGKGKVRNPSDINFLDNFIVVNDYHNYYTQFFDYSLQFIYQVGGKGQDLNQFDLPISGCAVNDELYICDKNNDRIVLLNSKSKEFKVIVEDRFIEGYLRRPSGITSDTDGKIYVADRGNGVIQKFDENLNFLEILRVENLKFNRPSSISILEDDNKKYIAIIERKSGINSSLNFYLLSDDEKSLSMYKHFESDIQLNDPQDMASSKSSFVYIADTLNRRIIQLNLAGVTLNEINMVEVSGNKMILVKTICVREDGDVFTADFDECIVYHFDSQLNIKNKINFSAIKSKIHKIRAVYATKDYLMLCVRGKNEVLIFNYDGDLLKEVNSIIKSGIDWNHPVKICKKESGEILIADKENDRIIMFDNEVNLIINKTEGYNF
jgi:hypothetical protein